MKHTVALALSVSAALLSACRYPEEYNPLLEPRGEAECGLEVLLPAARITEADSVRAEALVILPDGTKRPADDVAWESLSAAVLSVDADGVVYARTPGRGTICARRGSMSATADLEVERRTDWSRVMIAEVFYDAAGSDALAVPVQPFAVLSRLPAQYGRCARCGDRHGSGGRARTVR